MKIHKISLDVIDSTNLYARQRAKELINQTPALITARMQTAGKGQHGRSWHSPDCANFYGTFVLYFERERADLSLLSAVLALSLVEAAKHFGAPLSLKAPNDLMHEGKKVGGLLGESTPIGSGTLLILGAGINLNMPQEELKKIDQSATSLKEIRGLSVDREAFIEKLIACFLPKIELFQTAGFLPFEEEYRSLILPIGLPKQ